MSLDRTPPQNASATILITQSPQDTTTTTSEITAGDGKTKDELEKSKIESSEIIYSNLTKSKDEPNTDTPKITTDTHDKIPEEAIKINPTTEEKVIRTFSDEENPDYLIITNDNLSDEEIKVKKLHAEEVEGYTISAEELENLNALYKQESSWTDIFTGYFKYSPLDHIKDAISHIKWPTSSVRETYQIKIKKYIENNKELMGIIKTAQGPTITSSQEVIDKLKSHAENTYRNISKDQITEWVTVGENIAKLLKEQAAKPLEEQDGKPKNEPLTVKGDSGMLTIESNPYTIRALTWYMMASAAAQDVARNAVEHEQPTASDMVTSGSIIMKDPGNAIFKFLESSPEANNRTSSHFQDRLGHQEKHLFLNFFSFKNSPSQRGIEDYEGLLPGHGGAMVFDRLKSSTKDGMPEIFIKFEAVGCPAWIDDETYNKLFYTPYLFYSLVAGASLNIQHSAEFLTTRLPALTKEHAQKEIVRQEHLYKGRLSKLFEELNKAFENAYTQGVEKPKKDNIEVSIKTAMKDFGLPAALGEIKRLTDIGNKTNNKELVENMDKVMKSIEKETTELGKISNRHNIERRGAEVHISLDPKIVHDLLQPA